MNASNLTPGAQLPNANWSVRMLTSTYHHSSNIYSRRVLAGEFQIVNPWLLRDLVDLGLWDDDMKNRIIGHQGSIQNSMPGDRHVIDWPRVDSELSPSVSNIPADLKAIYKVAFFSTFCSTSYIDIDLQTVWEISQKAIIDMVRLLR